MVTDMLNENVFDMPEDIEQAQLRIQRNNQGRRLAGLRMKQIQDGLLSHAAPWTQAQLECICQAAMSTYDRDRIYQLERELEALRGENVGLRTQLDNGVVTVPQKDQQTLEDVNACLRVIKLMASQMSECKHAGNLMSLPGWRTLWCPKCDKDQMFRPFDQETTKVESNQRMTTSSDIAESTTKTPVKFSLNDLLMKNKIEQSTAKCKCSHDGKDVCLHAGSSYVCSKCMENCIPF